MTLLKLSNDRGEGASKNVSTLVQALIDQKIQPDEFTQRIQKELNLSEKSELITLPSENTTILSVFFGYG